MKLSTLSFRAASAAAFLSVVTAPLHALNVSFDNSSTDGTWMTATNWNNDLLPSTADSVFIRGGRTATLSGNAGTITDMFFGEATLAGSLVINSGGSLATTGNSGIQIGRSSVAGSVGTITMNGGSLTSPFLYVGANPSGTNAGSGTLTISGGTVTSNSQFTVGGASSNRTGLLQVNGSGSTISGTGAFSLTQWGTVNFTFDTTGVTKLNFGTINLGSTGTAGAVNINGASYTGGTAAFTLFDATTSLTNYSLSAFSIAGFDSLNYTTSLAFDIPTQSVILTVTAAAVPEPSTYAAAVGMLALAFTASRRRRQA